MKLNLIPTSAVRQGGSKVAYVIMLIMIVVSCFLALRMKNTVASKLSQAKADVAANQGDSDKVNAVSSEADHIMSEESGPLLNTKLVQDMKAHCSVYPDFYTELFRSIPSYFRITAVAVTPNDGNTATLTMTGTVGSLHEYTDLILALMRIKGAQQVTRSGYQLTYSYVQPLEADTQHTWKTMPGEASLTDDPIQRLDTKIAASHSTDFVGIGTFGTPGLPRTRGAMPTETLLTVGVVLTRNLMTPNPRATLAGMGAAFASAPASEPAVGAAKTTGAKGAPAKAGGA
jgi:hypothetical protein